jgi:hypothetical protein
MTIFHPSATARIEPVRLKVESKFTVLHAFVQELDGEHFILIGNQRE